MVASIDRSQEIFANDIMRALKSSLKHRSKHVLGSLRLYGDQQVMRVVNAVILKMMADSPDRFRKKASLFSWLIICSLHSTCTILI